MKSGMLAAETAFNAITSTELETNPENPVDMAPYEQAVKDSWIWKELHQVRNLRPSFHNPLGLYGGVAYSGLDSIFLRGMVPWTFRNKVEDYAHTKKARLVSLDCAHNPTTPNIALKFTARRSRSIIPTRWQALLRYPDLGLFDWYQSRGEPACSLEITRGGRGEGTAYGYECRW